MKLIIRQLINYLSIYDICKSILCRYLIHHFTVTIPTARRDTVLYIVITGQVVIRNMCLFFDGIQRSRTVDKQLNGTYILYSCIIHSISNKYNVWNLKALGEIVIDKRFTRAWPYRCTRQPTTCIITSRNETDVGELIKSFIIIIFSLIEFCHRDWTEKTTVCSQWSTGVHIYYTLMRNFGCAIFGRDLKLIPWSIECFNIINLCGRAQVDK